VSFGGEFLHVTSEIILQCIQPFADIAALFFRQRTQLLSRF
jgi:hypothetical protein